MDLGYRIGHISEKDDASGRLTDPLTKFDEVTAENLKYDMHDAKLFKKQMVGGVCHMWHVCGGRVFHNCTVWIGVGRMPPSLIQPPLDWLPATPRAGQVLAALRWDARATQPTLLPCLPR